MARRSNGGEYYETYISSPLLHGALHGAVVASGLFLMLAGFGLGIGEAAGISSAVFLIVYLSTHSRLLQHSLWRLEVLVDMDLNGDGVKGEPADYDDEPEEAPEPEQRHYVMDIRGTQQDGTGSDKSTSIGVKLPKLKETTYTKLFDHAKSRWSENPFVVLKATGKPT